MDWKKEKQQWLEEEAAARIRGWDFSHIEQTGRYREERLPWDFRRVILEYLRPEHRLLDQDTGGGEFLQSLGHPPARTSATEGYPPNVALCEKLLPALGIEFRPAEDPGHLPFPPERFDVIVNRHGAFVPEELHRLLRPGGLFLTQQVGEDNDRELVELLLPGTARPFPGANLREKQAALETAGFTILRGEECFVPVRFFDVGALVWFARILEWEFPSFSVEGCLDRLVLARQGLERDGVIAGHAHRYLIVARKER